MTEVPGDAGPTLSVVIPTLNEATWLPALLGDLEVLGEDTEVLVVDGGSRDGTPELARASGARVETSPPGRARQLRTGARAARGRWLLFLHTDSRLSAGACAEVRAFTACADPDEAAHFPFALEADGLLDRTLEWGQRLRERWTGLVYGDQGLLISRSFYDAVGGYPPWPLMEDVGMVDRVRAAGRLTRLETPLRTSPRRYRHEGRLVAVLRNLTLVTLFRMGVSPETLAPWYPPTHPPPTDELLLVFAKAPRPGQVKTRLAADVGDDRAARIYRHIAEAVVRDVQDGEHRTRIVYTPPGAREEMSGWLGTERLEYRSQSDGDLGRRMERAFAEAFEEGAARVVVIGTDAPGVDGALVARAFSALRDHEVVVGPARDGGYYLLGLRRPFPELFRAVPWSTDQVLRTTLERTGSADIRAYRLPILTDVDRVDDLPSELRDA